MNSCGPTSLSEHRLHTPVADDMHSLNCLGGITYHTISVGYRRPSEITVQGLAELEQGLVLDIQRGSALVALVGPVGLSPTGLVRILKLGRSACSSCEVGLSNALRLFVGYRRAARDLASPAAPANGGLYDSPQCNALDSTRFKYSPRIISPSGQVQRQHLLVSPRLLFQGSIDEVSMSHLPIVQNEFWLSYPARTLIGPSCLSRSQLARQSGLPAPARARDGSACSHGNGKQPTTCALFRCPSPWRDLPLERYQ